MFFQILFTVVKGLLENEGHVIDKVREEPVPTPVCCTEPGCDTPKP